MLRSGECGEEPYISPFRASIRVVLGILCLGEYGVQLKTSRISSLRSIAARRPHQSPARIQHRPPARLALSLVRLAEGLSF